LHNAGFVHRDIKAENILMKTENGKEVYKLADFGFTKNIKDISFTILGTGAYMSPEIYNEDEYGFEIDMWAFGVLFYFMLNMEFPFKLHSAPKTKKKSEELIKLATDFSYKAAV
jgi:serine/threonine protein kinase